MITKNEQMLGYAPTHVEKEQLLSYFLYTYEMTWICPVFYTRKDSISAFIQASIEQESLDIREYSVEKTWWVYTLVCMREIMRYHGLGYAEATAAQILRRSASIPDDSLGYYVNYFHSIILPESPDLMDIRPLEMIPLKSSHAEKELLVKYFLDRHEDYIRVLKKYLVKRDVNAKYFEPILMRDRKLVDMFSDSWNSYFEFFVNYFYSTYGYKVSPKKMSAKDLDRAISDMILIYLSSTIANKKKIDALHVELLELTKDVKLL